MSQPMTIDGQDLPVPADVAWRILTCPAGVRGWFGQPEHPGMVPGAAVPLLRSKPALIEQVHDAALDVSLASGGRATIRIVPKAADRCRIEVEVATSSAGSQVEPPASAWRALLVAARFLVEQTKSARQPRQAVVVVHGIGNQRPMATVRRFTSALFASTNKWSKPDRISSSYELRRYQLPRTSERPRTDLFELYWADRVIATKMSQITTWLRSLLLRRPKNVSAQLRPITNLLWSVTALGALGVVLLIVVIGTSGISHLWKIASPLVTVGWLSVVVSILGSIAGAFVINVLGDAARYLDAAPDNVAVRQSIRQAGVTLLRRLHEQGQYDRIVLVGHSLGGVIAYDVIRQYWSEVHRSHRSPLNVQQPLLNARRAARPAASPGDRSDQRALWSEYRRIGNPWLVTDLVTVGSPLVHAGTLLARTPAELDELRDDRTLPTCPPRGDRSGGLDPTFPETYLVDGQQRSLRVLHHGAPFAVTAWTNLFAPVKAFVSGDLVGGPVREVFGEGIHDIPVNIEPAWRARSPAAHTSYWATSAKHPNEQALRALRQAIDVDSDGWLSRHVAAMPWESFVGVDR